MIHDDRFDSFYCFFKPCLSRRFQLNSICSFDFPWCTFSSGVEFLFFGERYCSIWFRSLSNGGESWSAVNLTDSQPRNYGFDVDVTKIATKENRSLKFFCNENVDDLCVCAYFDNMFYSLNDKYYFYTRVSNFQYIFSLLDISLRSFRMLCSSFIRLHGV